MRKIIAFVMSLVVVFMMVAPTGMTAFAAEEKDPLAIEIVTDKSSYGLEDTVNVTVMVKNQSGGTMKGLVIVPSMSKHLLTKDSAAKFEIAEISNNETKTVSFKAVLSRNANGLNFFQKFVLLFHYLFKGVKTKAFENVSYTDKSSLTAEKDVSHKVNDTINVSVWYDPVFISTYDVDGMNDVDRIIHNVINKPSFNDEPTQNQVEDIENALLGLEKNGLIVSNSINYDKEENCVTFMYSSGALGGVYLDAPSDEFNGINARTTNDVSYNQPQIYTDMSTANSAHIADALVLYSFNFPTDSQNFRRPFYDTLKSSWDSLGISTTLDTTVTVSDLKSINTDYEVVCFSGHGTTYGNSPAMCLTEKVSKSKDITYKNDIENKRIVRVSYEGYSDSYYLVLPQLFKNTYSSTAFINKFFFSECCCFFGEYGRYNYSFSEALLNKGAQSLLGYHNSVYATYSRESMKLWVELLGNGKTAKQAFNSITETYGDNDEIWYYKECGESSGRGSNEYAIPNLTGSENSRLTEEKITYQLTVNKGTGISSVSGGGTYKAGDTVTVTASVSSGYAWNNWTSSNTSLLGNSSNQTYSFKMPAGNVTLTASAVQKYNLTVSKGTGIDSVSNGGSYKAGESVTVTASVTSGYQWNQWTSSNTSLLSNSTNQTYSFEMPAGNVTLTASAALKKYTLTVNTGTGISSVSGSGSYAPGTSVTIKAVVSNGYTWEKWTSSNTSLVPNSTSQTYTFTMPSGNVTLTPSATLTKYTVTVAKGTGISSVTGGGTYAPGTSVTVNANLSNGYTWEKWTSNNTSLLSGSSNRSYTFKMPAGNVTLTASAVVTKYNVTVNTSTGISSVSGGGSYAPGSSVTVKAVVSNGYTWEKWTSSNTSLVSNSTSQTYTFTMPSGNVTLTPSATVTKYTVTVSKGTGISSVTGGGEYTPGSSVTVNATVADGYTWKQWDSSNTSLLAGSTSRSYSFVMPSGNVTLTATSTVTTYKLSYSANGGTGAPADQTGATSYIISSTRPTRVGYNFAGWSKSSGATSASYQPEDNITLSGNTTLYAVWSQYSISSGSNLSAPISYAGQIYWYKFTPSSSGTYVMYSTGDVDAYGYIYNVSGSELSNNDDGGDNRNFRLAYKLSSGTTYYYGVKYYSSSNTGTISVKFGPVYTISYSANGGSGAPSSQTKDWGKDITLSSDCPTQTGYDFLGWSTSSSATSASYQPGGTFSSNGNYTLYAIWNKITYKLSYNANNGTGAPDDQTGATTYTISSVRPTRVGYNFAGWATSSSASSASYQPGNTITLSGNLTLYAVWTQHSISSGSSLSTPIGYVGQIYWYKFTPSTNGTYVMYSTGSSDTYCYLYNSAGSQIAYNDDGGADSNFRLSYSLSSGTVYYFGVKYYSSSSTGTISVKFGPVYTISYSANGGSGTPSSQTKDWGKDITLSSDHPTQTGYSFLGWSTSSSATSASYQPSGTFSSNGNYTLYAVWSKVAATSLSLSSSSKTLTITDTGIEITECPDTVKVPDSIGLSVSHSWNYPTYTFTATVGPSNAYNLGVSVTSSDTSVVKVTSTSRSGNVTTITVQAQDVGYNNTKTATITVKLNDNSSVSKTCSITVKRPHSLNITSSNENVIKTWGGWTSPSAVGTAGQTYARVTVTVTTYQGNTASKTITVYPPDTFYTVKNSDYNGYAVRSTPGGTSVGGVNNYLTLPVTKCQYIDGATYGYVTYNNSTQGWGTGYGWIKMYSWN